MMSSVHLPFDIQAEILRRIDDTRSLIRFRSISKECKSFIDSPKFIADHSSAGQRQHHRLLVRYKVNESEKIKYVSVVDNDDSFPRDQYCPTPPSALSGLYDVKSMGSSHGLLGYYGYRGFDHNLTAVLWNPSIRRSVVIDVPDVLHPQNADTRVLFGFCPGTTNPKLVKIVTSYNPWKVEVFTLSPGVWRSPLCCKLPRKSIFLLLDPSVVISGIIYWLAFDIESDRGRLYDMLISFDLTTEEFEELHLPDTLGNLSLQLANRRESLVVLDCYKSEAETPVCDVWLMNHGGVPKSFQKLFSIKAPDNAKYNEVLSFRKNGEPIMGTIYDNEESPALQVYEHKSGCYRDLGICGLWTLLSVTSYRETLLLLDRPDATIH